MAAPSSSLRYSTVSFLSDYGLDDEFVGVVKSVIRAIEPGAAVLDVTHGIAAHDVRAGGLALARSAQYLVAGVVLAVVDPGVGTARRAVAVEVGGGESVLVGPDNGLLAPAVAVVGGAGRVVELTNAAYQLEAPGPTFAGRDVLAPAAAHLCRGVDLAELGDPVDPVALAPGLIPVARPEGATVVAEVLWADRFGNAQLNAGADDIEGWGDRVGLRAGTPDGSFRVARRVGTFGELASSEVGLLVDSYGLLAVVLDRASAVDELGLAPGTGVTLSPVDDEGNGTGDRGGSPSTPVTVFRRP